MKPKTKRRARNKPSTSTPTSPTPAPVLTLNLRDILVVVVLLWVLYQAHQGKLSVDISLPLAGVLTGTTIKLDGS